MSEHQPGLPNEAPEHDARGVHTEAVAEAQARWGVHDQRAPHGRADAHGDPRRKKKGEQNNEPWASSPFIGGLDW